jgi:hypothetical protein
MMQLPTIAVYSEAQQDQQEFSYNQNINAVIGEGIQECSDLRNDSCIAVMSALNNICKVAYFPNYLVLNGHLS